MVAVYKLPQHGLDSSFELLPNMYFVVVKCELVSNGIAANNLKGLTRVLEIRFSLGKFQRIGIG